jgi:hypothetical protein
MTTIKTIGNLTNQNNPTISVLFVVHHHPKRALLFNSVVDSSSKGEDLCALRAWIIYRLSMSFYSNVVNLFLQM